jgi:hypothetical protein
MSRAPASQRSSRNVAAAIRSATFQRAGMGIATELAVGVRQTTDFRTRANVCFPPIADVYRVRLWALRTYNSTCSESAKASSTSIPRYRTVLSSFR